MRVIKRKTLVDFWAKHPQTEGPLKAWFKIVQQADWSNMGEVQQAFSKAKALNGERMRFEICGGNYRLIATFRFRSKMVFINFIGTHADYDKIKALTVSDY